MIGAPEAWAELELEVDPQQQEIGRIIVLPALGRDTEALEHLDAFIVENQSWASYPIAGIYAMRGEIETAFKWLDQAYQRRDLLIIDMVNDPLLETLHDDPRWVDLLDKMGLPN